MSFFADKQTTEDLNLLDRLKNNAVARLFDEVVTAGGRRLMEQLFKHPLTDDVLINKRSSIFRYFSSLAISFPFSSEQFGSVENYLASTQHKGFIAAGAEVIYKKILKAVANHPDFEQLHSELCATINLLNSFRDFIHKLPVEPEHPYRENLDRIKQIYNHPRLQWLASQQQVQALPTKQLISYDFLLRNVLHKEMQELIVAIVHLDVYIAVSGVAAKKGFSYAKALPKQRNTLRIRGLYHPSINKAIGNELSLHQESNVIFLTGANMAGKSTLMKSFGISMYLAHMGFPVAADEMEFSVKDGIYTSINVPDNIDLGYSHFYAEVLRVKKVAEEVASGKDLIVIFDELFKGTNVKDAYDATLSITQAFSGNHNCFFVISTHIVEVGAALADTGSNFQFLYLPTIMEGVTPRYTYKLAEGITHDKQGMIIIENEGIIDIIRKGKSKV